MQNLDRIAIALATALFLLAAAGDATAASYWQCTNAFEQSDANDSCQGVAIKVETANAGSMPAAYGTTAGSTE